MSVGNVKAIHLQAVERFQPGPKWRINRPTNRSDVAIHRLQVITQFDHFDFTNLTNGHRQLHVSNREIETSPLSTRSSTFCTNRSLEYFSVTALLEEAHQLNEYKYRHFVHFNCVLSPLKTTNLTYSYKSVSATSFSYSAMNHTIASQL